MRLSMGFLGGLALVTAVGSSVSTLVSANALGRDRDPVILTGADLPRLSGVAPSRIVAFRWEGTWRQIPVQVDERAVVDFGTIYDTTATGLTVLTYTDTSTFTGPDPDPGFDGDDELILRARDAGDARATGPEPAGAIPGSGYELSISNPLGTGLTYAYLFVTDGTLDPAAGSSPVDYVFDLLSGDYKTTYRTRNGPNPEDSRVTTPAYSVRFSDRWIRDETSITAGGANGADILDRHKSLFAPGNCARSENTFSNGEGAFIVNRTGPVRALRGYVGANSGPTTYRLHRFYEAREDALTALRVHPISGIVDFFDYSPAASGMVYRNDLNPAGVVIDGSPDAVTLGRLQWEMVTGVQGTLAMTSLLETDIPGLNVTSYYSDDSTPLTTQCTGDPFEYGASGVRIIDGIPNTDPYLGSHFVLEATRVIVYDAPGMPASFAESAAAEAAHPLVATATPYAPTVAVAAERPSPTRLTVDPNPARRLARVSLALAEEAEVSLRLYDTAGRARATLAGGRLPSGRHEFTRDLSTFPPGVYFVRVEIEGRREMSARIVRVR